MDLQQLATFRTIATLGSFSQSAEILGFAQSTVSEHIKNLETELGARLFQRAGSRRVALTQAGELFLDYAIKMLNLEEEIKSEVNQPAAPHGLLSVRVPETVSIHYLPPVVARFHQRFPRVNLAFLNCTYFELQEELGTGNADLGFLITDRYETPDLETELLRSIPLVMVAGAGHPLAGATRVDMAALKSEPLLVPANDCSYVQMLERVLTEEKVRLPLVWRFNSLAAIIAALETGSGLAVLPEIAVREEVQAGRLAVLPWREQSRVEANLLMLWRKGKWIPPAMGAFMDLAREALARPVL